MSEEIPALAADKPQPDVLRLTSDIVAAYVSKNSLPTPQLAEIISSVHATLTGLSGSPQSRPAEALKPAVPIRKSITPDYIVCLEDGKKLKMLKRHLRTEYGLTPDEYRARWGLPHDYPMVAPNYAEQRSQFAKQIGLGKKAPVSKGRKKGAKAKSA